MGYLFRIIRSGPMHPAGVVDVEFLGAKVGELDNWTLTRRGDIGPDAGLYDLRAVFSFVVDALWNDTEYAKRIVLYITNTPPKRRLIVHQQPGFPTTLVTRNLLMEGVTITEERG